jgi:hypothetical protein
MTTDISLRYIEAELDRLGVVPVRERGVSKEAPIRREPEHVAWKPSYPGEEPPF